MSKSREVGKSSASGIRELREEREEGTEGSEAMLMVES